MTRRAVIFVDYENMHRCAMGAFDVRNGHFSPWALGQRIVDVRNANRHNAPSVLHQVRVYRGLPDSRRQPKANAANQAQTSTWLRACPQPDSLLIYRRPLRYPPDWPNGRGAPQEKGVDVALAVDLVQMTYQGAVDVAVVCSHDTDLSPALDVVRTVSTSKTHLEVASWSRLKRISYSTDPNMPWCHRLSRADFDSVSDNSTYP